MLSPANAVRWVPALYSVQDVHMIASAYVSWNLVCETAFTGDWAHKATARLTANMRSSSSNGCYSYVPEYASVYGPS